MYHSPQQIRAAEAALKRRLQTGYLRYHYRGLGFLFQGRETIPARMVVSASVDTTRGTSPRMRDTGSLFPFHISDRMVGHIDKKCP